MGDDEDNLEEDFVNWKDDFWTVVCELKGKDPTAEGSFRTYELVDKENLNMDKVFTGEQAIFGSYQRQRKPYSQKNPFLAPVKVHVFLISFFVFHATPLIS